ncbi:alanine:cation symporter family protein [Paraclostridium bifermentans]|nr:alanine:cation symporter family protein [Paraclostridium bifermentans]
MGAANIVGVPLAIATGGPGAIFWMWIIAIFGCALKYSEIILGIKYRVKNENGEYVGGPMYYLKNGAKMPILGSLFAFS